MMVVLTLLTGLSPPVRGNPMLRRPPLYLMGSIPACAGEPPVPTIRRKPRWVYPRLCGGTARLSINPARCGGLSPPVRGNQAGLGRGVNPFRSIPACAGEPAGSSLGFLRLPVYPRLCGGTSTRTGRGMRGAGLSPPVRGNPSRRRPRFPGAGVYPRLCGGTWAKVSAMPMTTGLSPPVRGNPAAVESGGLADRSIPACAGEPRTLESIESYWAVYPRLCGGTALTTRSCGSVCGLSPPVRGNHQPVKANPEYRRSIPACAGEPVGQTQSPAADTVYPRLCGGTRLFTRTAEYDGGLSPPVRGNRRCGWR